MSLPLKQLGALAAQIGFGLTTEAQIPVTLHLGGTKVYDAATDTETTTGSATVVTRAISYRRANTDANQAPDKTFDVRRHTLIIQASDLGGRDISQTDYVVEADGRWEIQDVQPDPTGSIWTLEVRR